MSSALRRFGILECLACGVEREFVSYDPACDHITDAFCAECGYVFGRRTDVDLGTPSVGLAQPMVRLERHRVPVIDDETAARALARLARVAPGKADAAAAAALARRARAQEVQRPHDPPRDRPPAVPEPLDVADVDDGSRRAAFLRSLQAWPSPKSP